MQKVLEAAGVDGVDIDRQAVAAGHRLDRLGAERTAQMGDVDLQGLGG